jgi:hypothetical protein
MIVLVSYVLTGRFREMRCYSNNTEEEFKNLAKNTESGLIQVLMFTNEGDEIYNTAMVINPAVANWWAGITKCSTPLRTRYYVG